MICKNCDNTFEGKFCNQCGQPAATHDMNFHFLIHDVQHGLLHLDKGFVFTIKELFKRPGHAIREYLEGRRIKHFKPVSLILVLAGTYGLLSHFFHVDIISDSDIHFNGTQKGVDDMKEIYSEISDWVAGHYAFVSLLILPIYALGTFITFRRQGYNWVEHLVLNAYLAGQRLVLHILAFPLVLLFNGTTSQKMVNDWLGFVITIITLWTMFQFFDKLKKWSVFWRTALGFFISWVIYITIAVVILANVLPDVNAK
jgi:hypothetical protein